MISMKMDVVLTTGETVSIIVSPKVQVDFERHYKLGIANAFGGDEMRMEYVYYLAWKAMAHVGKTAKTFDDWLDDVADIEMIDDEEPDPLALAP